MEKTITIKDLKCRLKLSGIVPKGYNIHIRSYGKLMTDLDLVINIEQLTINISKVEALS